MTNAWHPRFSTLGKLARGFGEITVEGRNGKIAGTYPVWDGDVLYWISPTDVLVREGTPQGVQGNGPVAARGGRWALRQGGVVRLSDGRTVPGVGSAWLDDGWLVVAGVEDQLFLLPPVGQVHQPISMDRVTSVSSPQTGASFAVNRVGTDDRREVWGFRSRAEAPVLLNVAHHEFDLTLLPTPHGLWALSYTSDDVTERVLLRAWGDLRAHVLASQPTVRSPAGWYDATTDSFRVAWSDKAGNGTIKTVTRHAAGASKTWPPEHTAPVVAPFPRKMWMAPFFSHSERYGSTPLSKHAGNAICLTGDERDAMVLIRELEAVKSLGTPLIVLADRPIPARFHDLTIAWWVSGATVPELGAATRQALETQAQKPVIAYLDADAWPTSRPSWVTGRVWPSVQAYRKPGESLPMFETRVGNVLARVTLYGGPLVLTPRFDDFNGSVPVADIVACMPSYAKWTRQFPIVGIMPFSDRRGRGIAVEPELRAWAEAFLGAIPARPSRDDYWEPDDVPPPPPPPPPDDDEDDDMDPISSPEAFEILTKPGGVGDYLVTGKGAANFEELILKAWKQPVLWAVYREILVTGDERAAKRYIRDRAFKEDKKHWPGRDQLDPL